MNLTIRALRVGIQQNYLSHVLDITERRVIMPTGDMHGTGRVVGSLPDNSSSGL